MQLWKDLEPPGALTDNMAYDFCFSQCDMKHETFNGAVVRVRYYIKVYIYQSYNKLNKEQGFVVRNIQDEPPGLESSRKHIGCEGMFHLELELASLKYHLNDCILAKITFHSMQ